METTAPKETETGQPVTQEAAHKKLAHQTAGSLEQMGHKYNKEDVTPITEETQVSFDEVENTLKIGIGDAPEIITNVLEDKVGRKFTGGGHVMSTGEAGTGFKGFLKRRYEQAKTIGGRLVTRNKV